MLALSSVIFEENVGLLFCQQMFLQQSNSKREQFTIFTELLAASKFVLYRPETRFTPSCFVFSLTGLMRLVHLQCNVALDQISAFSLSRQE